MNPGSTSERDYLLNQLNAIEKSLQKQFGETYKSAINLGEIRNVINSGDSFSFDKNPSAKKKVDSMLKTLQGNISTFVGDKIETVGRVATQTAKDGVNKQIKPTKSQQKFTDDLINDATKTARQNASESAGEYKLSPQVWNFSDYGKKEIQAMVNAGIRKGLTVQKIADSVLPYLKNPNLEESEPEFQAIKTPKGVYKSAYKNALRMARTEVLRGYDEAEWNSYQNDPMVVGFEIKISNNHTTKQGGKKRPLKDMCDELAGKYPKSFKFTGWHPQCRCTMIPITIGADELGDLMEAEENGETFVSKDAITQLPENFTEWYDANKDRFNTNNEPYFLSENKEIINTEYNNAEPIIKRVKPNKGDTVPLKFPNYPEVDSTERNEFADTISELKLYKVTPNPISRLTGEISEKNIIDRLSGTDTTKGSCASLAHAYIANKLGYDVIDYRGGFSRLSISENNGTICRNLGKCFDDGELESTAQKAFDYVKEKEECIFSAGRHASVVRRKNGRLEFLELQGEESNTGFLPLYYENFTRRFSYKKDFKGRCRIGVLKIDDIKKNLKSYKEMLNYINNQ